MSVDPYGTIRAQVIDLQGNAVGGAVSNNDWRLVVDNENLVFQHYDATANNNAGAYITCLLYTSPSPRDQRGSRMPSSA